MEWLKLWNDGFKENEIQSPYSRLIFHILIGVYGFNGSGVQKPALVRRDVAMKLISHSMGLAFHHHILTCQVWARGSILVPGLYLGCVFTRKA